MADFSVRIVGADKALKALRSLEPSVAREVGREVGQVGTRIRARIVAMAPTQPPMSGWRNVPAAKGRTRGGAGWPAWENIGATSRRSGMSVRVTTTSAVAAIYESAGAQSSGESPQGEQFIRNLSRYGGLVQSGAKKGRLGRKVIAEMYAAEKQNIENACDRAVAEVNRRMP